MRFANEQGFSVATLGLNEECQKTKVQTAGINN